ncbi:sugar-binding transcriptional regulator [Alicyclobacillus contaminans]|uniref:sugar-binding transcriptional regulator n=1 Tax=Alicyclobacillus contaminans TaxID=392016 RepID=UPI0004014DF5|nr:sugar-binding transcriptional regulator [Alicyclobacillus contaminans]
MKIAHMYYDDGATQAEIAQVLGVSRPLISKYLAKAKETGIVEIRIRDELAHPPAGVEAALERKYGLREAIVVSESGEQGIKRSLGLATGNYVVRIAKKHQIIGVSSGTTLYEVANQMPRANLAPLTIVPLVGGMGDERVDIHANHIAVQIASRVNADYKLLHAPVVVDSPEAKALFLQQSSIADVFQLGSRADIAIVGIGGSPEHSTMVKTYMGEDYGGELANADVAGDICYNFINAKGQASSVSWNRRVIALSLDALQRIPVVIGVAHGAEKVQAIHAALVGKLVSVLVTDQSTAEQLLKA